MRDYGKVAPTFWTGPTGKEIKRHGPEAVVVAMYLLSSPHSSMLGLFWQPVLYMAHETGLGEEGAWKGLRACIEAGFCEFDAETDFVWVLEMASYQIATELKASDKRCAGIQKDYDALPENPFLARFYDRYARAFNLSKKREHTPQTPKGPASPFEAPSKPGAGAGAGAKQDLMPPQTAAPTPAPAAPPLPTPKPTPAPTSPPRADRGTRLEKPFTLPDDWREWCATQRPDLDPLRVAEQFADFWHAKTGKDAAKLDWFATWRNWCRGQKAPAGPARPGAAADWTGSAL